MRLDISKREFLAIITIQTDKLMSSNAPQLKSELAIIGAEGYKNLIIDLEKVDFVDSSGLSSLLMAKRMCEEAEGILCLCHINPKVQSLIKISQLEDVLNTFDSVSKAEEYIRMIELGKEIKG
ncbi:MAG: STAS domain-containing protein [Chitinophagales bacterium]|nr:STAS domain-containing protein [Chitinophagales bacterium]